MVYVTDSERDPDEGDFEAFPDADVIFRRRCEKCDSEQRYPAEAEELTWEPRVPFVRSAPKVGRNDSCPCGSGRKYKRCCSEADAVKRSVEPQRPAPTTAPGFLRCRHVSATDSISIEEIVEMVLGAIPAGEQLTQAQVVERVIARCDAGGDPDYATTLERFVAFVDDWLGWPAPDVPLDRHELDALHEAEGADIQALILNVLEEALDRGEEPDDNVLAERVFLKLDPERHELKAIVRGILFQSATVADIEADHRRIRNRRRRERRRREAR